MAEKASQVPSISKTKILNLPKFSFHCLCMRPGVDSRMCGVVANAPVRITEDQQGLSPLAVYHFYVSGR